MKKFFAIIVAILSLSILSACGGKDVSFATLEEAKTVARDNALFNAQRFRAENPDVRDFTAVSNGDSSQTQTALKVMAGQR